MIAVEQPHRRAIPPQMPDFSDPLVLLVQCHRKIEAHLKALEKATDSLRNGTLEEKLSAFFAIDMARAHFAGPGVKHTEDEELSLFPRLRERGGEAVEEALAAMRSLEVEHRTVERLEAEFDHLAARLPRDGSWEMKDIDRLDQLAAMLIMLYRPHIRIENELLFPVAARVLSAGDLQAIGSEMRARRRLMLHRLQAN